MKHRLLSTLIVIGGMTFLSEFPTEARAVTEVLEDREPTYEWYQEFEEVIDLLPEEYSPDGIEDHFSDEDLELFYRVVSAEIGSDCHTFDQRVNVASVILHRWINDGQDGLDTVLIPSQFASVNKIGVEVTDEVKAACEYALWFDGDFAGAIFFNNARTWDGIYEYLGYDGAHYFYR